MTTQTDQTCRWIPPCQECGVSASKARPRYSITLREGRLMCGECGKYDEAQDDARALYGVLVEVPMTRAQRLVVLRRVDRYALGALRRMAATDGYREIAEPAESLLLNREKRGGSVL